MSTSLILTSKLLSLTDQRWIHDQQHNLVFEASRIGIFKRTFQLRDAQGQICATLDPQQWKPDPAWEISGQLGEFAIKRKKKSWQRYYWIESGPFDGVEIEGGYHDRAFRIRQGEHIIAEADEKSFSSSSKHTITILDDTQEHQLLVGIVSVAISKEKQQAHAAGSTR